MFSLQTIFGSGKLFYTLHNDAALAANDLASHEVKFGRQDCILTNF
jgi:hypothetical protein